MVMGRTKRKLSLECDASLAMEGCLQDRVTGWLLITLSCWPGSVESIAKLPFQAVCWGHSPQRISVDCSAEASGVLIRFTLVGGISVQPGHPDLIRGLPLTAHVLGPLWARWKCGLFHMLVLRCQFLCKAGTFFPMWAFFLTWFNKFTF